MLAAIRAERASEINKEMRVDFPLALRARIEYRGAMELIRHPQVEIGN